MKPPTHRHEPRKPQAVFDEAGLASARSLLDSLKTFLSEEVPEGDERLEEARYELLTDMQGFAVGRSHVGNRVCAYLVVLEENFKDQDADRLTELLCRIQGVLSVVPVDGDAYSQTAEQRVKLGFAVKLYEFVRELSA